jgi:hypothetical protein|tara:strand:+ start:7789 stop:9459 length:1671 start_codon:yes stop_codon:yes gene_type:complete
MASTSLDTDINNYTIAELLTILNLTEENVNNNNITSQTDYYINKFTKDNNVKMSDFFEQIQERLIDYIEDDVENDDDNNEKTKQDNAQATQWLKNEYLIQTKDPIQNNKVTQRANKIKVFADSSVPTMKREQLGVNNNYNVPVAQDVLNPNLKNTTQRIVNLDSIFRQSSDNSGDSSTNYTLDLSEPLINVLSLRLYSFQIPYSWYTIDTSYGNTFFWISFVDTNQKVIKSVRVSIEPGNYTSSTIITAMKTSMITAGFVFSGTTPTDKPFIMNSNNNKITFNLNGTTYDSGTYTIDATSIVTFFDLTNEITSDILPTSSTSSTCNETTGQFVNQTLGWFLGYRTPYFTVLSQGNTADAMMNLYGPKYFILSIDDLNQNHLNDGLVGITEQSKNVKLPGYYSRDLPYTCVDPSPLGDSGIDFSDSNNIGTDLSDKLDVTYTPIPQVLPRAPRQLTQNQIYTINEIIKNNRKTLNYKIKSPNVSDTLAIIPIKLGSAQMGDAYVDFGGSLQDNKRVYFGPVNIERMRVKLYDDRGNIVNLNGNDWSVTLICESLYQY